MNFNFPKYCNFHKFLLVEEIALNENPALLHYGKCSVLGYLSSPDCLNSISIPNVKKEYQLKDGEINLKLYAEFYPKEYLLSTVQIFGEVRLYDRKCNKVSLDNFESASSLIHKLRNYQTSLENTMGLKEREPSGTNDKSLHPSVKFKLERKIIEMKETYSPIIQVYSIRRIPNAKELIAENLYYRLIQKRKNNHFGKIS